MQFSALQKVQRGPEAHAAFCSVGTVVVCRWYSDRAWG